MIRTAAAFALFAIAAAPTSLDPPAWTRPTPAFRVVGPIWYVGTEGLAAYFIRTRSGAILLDGTMAQNVPAIERNIASLGVALHDVKLLLNSHAHFDHAGGLQQLKRDTGARLAAGADDAAALAAGVPPGETSYGVIRFPAVAVDRPVHDGEQVTLGHCTGGDRAMPTAEPLPCSVTLTAIATPGHTPGNTSWALRVSDHGRPLDVLFVGSLTVAGNRLVGNARYPGIVAGFRHSFARLAQVHADVLLPAHPETADVLARGRRAAAGEANAFVAPELLPRLVREAAAAFEVELTRQQAAAHP